MSKRDRLSGNEAIATAMRQINPDVFAAFPITPSTEIPQYFAQYVADGAVDTVFVPGGVRALVHGPGLASGPRLPRPCHHRHLFLRSGLYV